MPSAYAHYRLGQEVFKELPRDIRERIAPVKELYDIGLHGPDIMFYHSPVPKSSICRLARDIHYRSGRDVFTDANNVLKAHDSALYYAYLYGYLCHFALDCMSHGYVRGQINESGLGHNEIEMEFDRILMVNDGLNPLEFCPNEHIIPSMRNAAVISAFYGGTKPRDIQSSMRSMIKCMRLLMTPEQTKRSMILTGFKMTGKYKTLSGLVMSMEPNPKCQASNRRLLELYKMAVPLAIKLITEYSVSMAGKCPLDPHYRLNFESENTGADLNGQLQTK